MKINGTVMRNKRLKYAKLMGELSCPRAFRGDDAADFFPFGEAGGDFDAGFASSSAFAAASCFFFGVFAGDLGVFFGVAGMMSGARRAIRCASSHRLEPAEIALAIDRYCRPYQTSAQRHFVFAPSSSSTTTTRPAAHSRRRAALNLPVSHVASTDSTRPRPRSARRPGRAR
jgi:hypothetical protein